MVGLIVLRNCQATSFIVTMAKNSCWADPNDLRMKATGFQYENKTLFAYFLFGALSLPAVHV